MKHFTLTICLAFLSSFFVFATDGALGSRVDVQWLSAANYKVVVSVYRLCDGNPIQRQNLVLRTQSNSLIQNVSVNLIRMTNISNQCASNTGVCDPSNTVSNRGIEEHIYSTTIDFSQSPFDKFYKANEPVRFEYEIGDRLPYYLGNIHNYAIVDFRYGNNSTPALGETPQFFACLNQPIYYSAQALSETDGDSISYRFGKPYNHFGDTTKIGFYTIDPYYPGSLKPPYANPNASPPIGISLDPVTGFFAVTPIGFMDTFSVFVFELVSWRKDSIGIYRESAITRIDHSFIVKTCPENNPPAFTVSKKDEWCVGELGAIQIIVNDPVKKPPPPQVAPDPDTVFSTFFGLPSGAYVVNRPDTFPNRDTLMLYWTPSLADSGKTYNVKLQVRDNACPFTAMSSRTIPLKVAGRSYVTGHSTKALGCNEYEIKFDFNPPKGYSNSISRKIFWGNYQLNDLACFFKNGTNLSNNLTDTLTILNSGTYVVQTTIATECRITYFDTIVVSQPVPKLFAKNNVTLCNGIDNIVKQDLYPDSLFSSYQWSGGGIDSFYMASFPKDSANPIIRLFAQRKDGGCQHFDFKRIVGWDVLPKLQFNLKDTTFCGHFDTTLTVSIVKGALMPGSNFRVQFPDSSFSASLSNRITKAGKYLAMATAGVCKVEDTATVTFQEFMLLVQPFASDSQIVDSSITLNAKNPGSRFLWNTGDTTQTIKADSGLYWVKIENECGLLVDSIYLKPKEKEDGILNLEMLGINIYPNPNNGTFNIHCDCNIRNIELYDLLGRNIEFDQKKGTNSELEITIKSKIIGAVYIKITTDDGSYSMPLIIQ
ncbi:MAG: T9SS type A sorting domain-containing protein [Flavobacteriales bacterium]|nr:T9SS type A sorting domain-containing protein [Flavobacteriales bacterium]